MLFKFDHCDDPVIISADIEDHTFFINIGVIKCVSYINKILPIYISNDLDPLAHRSFGCRMIFPEFPYSSFRNYSHKDQSPTKEIISI